MQTTVNGEEYAPDDKETIAELVEKRTGIKLLLTGKAADNRAIGLAVALDGEVVPRSRWATTPVAGTIDIVTAVQGG